METVTGTLHYGVLVDGEPQKEFEMRAATTGDMFDAESMASVEQNLAYQGALIALQVVRLGSLDGPLPFSLVRKLKPKDFGILVEKQRELERLGEAEQHG